MTKLPHILLIGSVVYFKIGDDVYCVLGRSPNGFLEFDLWEAIIWQPLDVDSAPLREFIVEHFKLRS